MFLCLVATSIQYTYSYQMNLAMEGSVTCLHVHVAKLSAASMASWEISRTVGRLIEVGWLRAKEDAFVHGAAKNLFVLRADTPWKQNHTSMYIESIMASIEHAHNNAVQIKWKTKKLHGNYSRFKVQPSKSYKKTGATLAASNSQLPMARIKYISDIITTVILLR